MESPQGGDDLGVCACGEQGCLFTPHSLGTCPVPGAVLGIGIEPWMSLCLHGAFVKSGRPGDCAGWRALFCRVLRGGL